MKNRKVMCVILGILGLVLSLQFLLEGGFHIRAARRNELVKLLDADTSADMPPLEWPPVLENDEKPDVIVAVCRDQVFSEVYYILEFSKNAAFDRYFLTDFHRWDCPQVQFNTVVSSSIHDYAYCVDIAAGTVDVYEGSLHGTAIHSVFACILSILLIVYPFLKKDNR